jgi:hypothetical protein
MLSILGRGLSAALVVGSALFAPLTIATATPPGPDHPPHPPSVLFDPAPAGVAPAPEGGLVVQAEPGGWDLLLSGPAQLEIPLFPLRAAGLGGGADGPADVTLTLERFNATKPGARFVLGSRTGRDRPLDFDPGSIKLYRGPVEGLDGPIPGSWAVLAASERQAAGLISLGAGGAGMWAVSSRARGGGVLAPGQLSVFPVTAGGAADLAPGVELCRVVHGGEAPGRLQSERSSGRRRHRRGLQRRCQRQRHSRRVRGLQRQRNHRRVRHRLGTQPRSQRQRHPRRVRAGLQRQQRAR